MNLKRIRTFMMLVEHKNFSTVAELLSISQPAVSKQLKTLEEELGVILLNRDTLEPTEAGKLTYKKGKDLLFRWEELVDQCHSLQGQLTGVLRIGTSTIPGSYLVPPILREFRDRYPRMEVRLSVHDSEEVMGLLRDGRIDVGVVGKEPRNDLFVGHVIANDKMLLVGPADSEEVDGFGDVKGKPFIFREEGSGTWHAAKEGLRRWGGSVDDLNCVAEVDSTEAVISMVEAGLGYSIVSCFAAKPATRHGRIKILAELPMERNFYLTYLASKQQNPAITAIVNLMVKE
ncbi:selenium metabolism-associated LysR family transcriptional regulator [Effusibacillus lacus]|uniref:LysR family transcriptional regulator n=1 Tax=Effusibacillus lacus TaxID=1348429 RepID=A0A292YJQ4_9BACL|nr:selenium metabolism-associated LysR family transcriptional regulator [Effusibacillus lacus]TCS75529.1 DNA-binding transcriptional LysR family regulator [Effusibacillus lacus]GAX88993.1 LysR family transcriptional regulator [Effusibacillus lacus]